MGELVNKEELKFRRGGKTLVTIDIGDDKIVVLIIFGKAEREKFKAARNSFSSYINNFYDECRTYHDGKWMFFS
jgi:hypothetical protein